MLVRCHLLLGSRVKMLVYCYSFIYGKKIENVVLNVVPETRSQRTVQPQCARPRSQGRGLVAPGAEGRCLPRTAVSVLRVGCLFDSKSKSHPCSKTGPDCASCLRVVASVHPPC